MKTTHFRFRTPCGCRIVAESAFNGTPYRNEGKLLDARKTARLYERNSEIYQFLEENKEDITSYVDEELMEEVGIVKMILGDFGCVNGDFCLIHHVWVKGQVDETSEEELSKIQDYIQGQLSDGWGESLEQKCAMTETVYWSTPYYDEDSMHWDVEENEEEAEYFLDPWSQVAEIEVFPDAEEEELNVEGEFVASMKRSFDKFTRYVVLVRNSSEFEELKSKVYNAEELTGLVSSYSYPMLIPLNQYEEYSATKPYVAAYRLLAHSGTYNQYTLIDRDKYTESIVKLSFYDAITELLKR